MEKRKVKEWRDVTLAEFLQISDVFASEELDDEKKMFEVMKVLYGEGVGDLLLEDYAERVADLQFLGKEIKFKPWVKRSLKINGHEYTIASDMAEITAAQFFDIVQTRKGGDKVESYVKLLSYCLVPKGCKYGEGYDVKDVESDVRCMSVVDALEVVRFFFLTLKKLYRRLRIYLVAVSLTANRKSGRELRHHLNNLAFSLSSLELWKSQMKLLRL